MLCYHTDTQLVSVDRYTIISVFIRCDRPDRVLAWLATPPSSCAHVHQSQHHLTPTPPPLAEKAHSHFAQFGSKYDHFKAAVQYFIISCNPAFVWSNYVPAVQRKMIWSCLNNYQMYIYCSVFFISADKTLVWRWRGRLLKQTGDIKPVLRERAGFEVCRLTERWRNVPFTKEESLCLNICLCSERSAVSFKLLSVFVRVSDRTNVNPTGFRVSVCPEPNVSFSAAQEHWGYLGWGGRFVFNVKLCQFEQQLLWDC